MSNKKNISNNRKAFTLIEILIIVAIIGMLAAIVLVSLGIARNRAKDNSFKTVVKSVQTGLVSCCLNPTTTLNAYPANMNTCAGGGKYPDSTNIGSVVVDSSCNSSGNFNVTITPGTKNKGTIDHAVVTGENVTYYNTP